MQKTIKFTGLVLSLLILLTAFLPAVTAVTSADLTLYSLKTDGEANLMGTDNRTPVFSWKMKSDVIGQKQTAYRITVSEKDSGSTIWDSGKVRSEASANIVYDGKPLSAATAYQWKVTVWDKNGTQITSEPAYFETALFEDGSISGAEWIKMPVNNSEFEGDMSEYAISFDFEIVKDAMGFAFGATDNSHFYMWQINTNMENGVKGVYLRPHIWNGYGALWNPENVSNFAGYRIDDKVDIKNGQTYKMEIKVHDKQIDTYIDGTLVNSLNAGTFIKCGTLGFRHAKNDSSGIVETSYYDNITVTDKTGAVVFSEDFSSSESYKFAGGEVRNGRFYVEAKSYETVIMQTNDAVHYTVEADMTLTGGSAGIIFSATDTSNMYMWQFNTVNHAGQMYLRPHIWAGGNVSSNDISINKYFTVNDMMNKERHIKLDVTAGKVDTYIDGTLVNSYTSSGMIDGKIGFRIVNDGTSAEGGRFDNVVVTSYKNSGTETRSYDFDDGVNPFNGGVLLDGKLVLEGSSYVILESSEDEGTPVFRKNFDIGGKEITSARLYSTALGVYDVYINGERVGVKDENGNTVYDELKPGWTNYNKSVLYHTYDITDMLKSGKNAIASTVGFGWWTGAVGSWDGSISYGTYGNKDMAFLAKIVVKYSDGTSQVIGTDTSWKVTLDGPVRYSDIWNGETYNANYEGNFSSADYDDSAWVSAEISNDFEGEINALVGTNVRVRQNLTRTPQEAYIYEGAKATGTDYGEVNVIKSNEELNDGSYTIEAGQTLLIDVGQNMVGWPDFTVTGNKNTVVTVRFGEMLNDNGARSRGNDGPGGSIYTANYRSARSTLKYILSGDKAGESFHPAHTFFGYRYMEFTATDTVTITKLTSQVVGSDIEETGTITTSDESVNQLISNVIWGQRGNYLSVPTDCPQRNERLGWTGDTQVFIGAASYNADVSSFYLKWAQDIIDSQFDNGAYPDVVPYVRAVGGGNGAWGDAGIIVPYTLYKMYGNTQIISHNYDSMVKYMNFLDNGTYDGPGTAYGDWLAYEGTDSRYISVAYYAYDAMMMSEIAEVLGKTADAEKYGTLYENIKKDFQRRYVRSDGSMNINTQTAYLLALKFDLLPNEASKKLIASRLVEKIKNNGNKLSTGFVGTATITQTLSEIGESNMAYTLLLQRDNPSWLYSVDQGATTIWERWNSYTKETGFGDVGMNSFNHYSYGAVEEWMYRYMAGIQPDDEINGFKYFKLAPQIDTRTDSEIPANQKRMTYVSASYDSAYGLIKSEWKTDGEDVLTYNATVPANSSAEMTLPLLEGGRYLTVNGSTYALDPSDISADSISKIDVEGIEFVSADADTVTLKLDSGSYRVRLTEEIPEPEVVIIKGDVDDNGVVNVSDIISLKTLIMNGSWSDEQLLRGDMDDNKTLNVSDMLAIKNVIMNG